MTSCVMIGGAAARLDRLRHHRVLRAQSRSSRSTLFKNRTFTLAVDRLDLGRRRDVRHRGLPQPVLAARPRRHADRVGPAHHPDDGRPCSPRSVIGALISRSASGRRFMVLGSLLVVVGSCLLTHPQLRHRLPLGRRLDVRARRRPRHGHAEPHARRAERPPRSKNLGVATSAVTSSAASAARSASPSWARCSARSSPSTSRPASTSSPPPADRRGAGPRRRRIPHVTAAARRHPRHRRDGIRHRRRRRVPRAVPLAVITLIAIASCRTRTLGTLNAIQRASRQGVAQAGAAVRPSSRTATRRGRGRARTWRSRCRGHRPPWPPSGLAHRPHRRAPSRRSAPDPARAATPARAAE